MHLLVLSLYLEISTNQPRPTYFAIVLAFRFYFRRIIPLARYKASQETCPEALFDKGTVVMAIYPQTTCFYKGVIKEIPNAASDEYEVLFEDPRYNLLFICYYYLSFIFKSKEELLMASAIFF